MNNSTWMNDPSLKHIDPVKLQILSGLANNVSGKNANEMLPLMMSAINQANQKGVSFSSSEQELLLNLLMEQLSPEEKKKAETMVQMISAFHKK